MVSQNRAITEDIKSAKSTDVSDRSRPAKMSDAQRQERFDKITDYKSQAPQ